MKTICFIRPHTPESHAGRLCGPQRLASELAKHLSKEYNIINLLITKKKNSNNNIFHKNHSESEIILKKNHLLLFKTIRTLKKINPDIIHGHGSLNSALGLILLKKILKKKTILTFTDFKKNITNNYRILNHLDAIIVQTQFAKEKLIQERVNPKKIHVILYGIEEQFKQQRINEEIRNLSKKIILYYGDARVERGFQPFLDSIPKIDQNLYVLICLRNIHPPFKLEKIKEIINQRKNTKLLLVPEYPCSINDIIQSSDIIVLPFLHNTLEPPLTLMEVSTIGKPLITTNIGGNKEVISENATAIDNLTAENLAQAINELSSKKTTIKPRFYPWQETIQKIKEVYENQ